MNPQAGTKWYEQVHSPKNRYSFVLAHSISTKLSVDPVLIYSSLLVRFGGGGIGISPGGLVRLELEDSDSR